MDREASAASPNSTDAIRLFGLGFITLFLELALIRYLAGSIWNLGYFPNLVLLAVFVGMGLGFILHNLLGPRGTRVAFHLAPLALLALVLVVALLQPAIPGFGMNQGEIGGELFFTSTESEPEGALLLLFCFGLVVLVFLLVAQRTAKLFRLFSPLKAYTLDIAGSCAGILAFMLISALEIPAWIWFAAAGLVLVGTAPGTGRLRALPLAPMLIAATVVFWQDLASPVGSALVHEIRWSPYQRLDFVKTRANALLVFANQIGHQRMYDADGLRGSPYELPYRDRALVQHLEPYRRALIIGSGTGNDVAVALQSGIQRVDAVEIDPAIASLGERTHPLSPYQDSRVRLIVDDGRAVMTREAGPYDLIVFALTDSLVKVSPVAQLRLENYLFTLESVRRAFELLSPDGDIVFYNYYRTPWLVEKIADLATAATGRAPRLLLQNGNFVVLKVGRTNPEAAPIRQGRLFELPSDDWPFLYLNGRGFPSFYAWPLVGMLVVLGLFAWLMSRHRSKERLPVVTAFVLMGVAFLLLETKSVIQFSLLFGTTWTNNSLVFLAVLLLVLLANWLAALLRDRRHLRWVVPLLILSTLASLRWPLGDLLSVESLLVRFLLAAALTFSPIFFANLVFGLVFRDQELPERMFGWNLLGATLGGVLEYTSMALGYNLLAIGVAVCYAAVFVLLVAAAKPPVEG